MLRLISHAYNPNQAKRDVWPVRIALYPGCWETYPVNIGTLGTRLSAFGIPWGFVWASGSQKKDICHFSNNFEKRPRICSDLIFKCIFPGTFLEILRKVAFCSFRRRRDRFFWQTVRKKKTYATFRRISRNVPGYVRI